LSIHQFSLFQLLGTSDPFAYEDKANVKLHSVDPEREQPRPSWSRLAMFALPISPCSGDEGDGYLFSPNIRSLAVLQEQTRYMNVQQESQMSELEAKFQIGKSKLREELDREWRESRAAEQAVPDPERDAAVNTVLSVIDEADEEDLSDASPPNVSNGLKE
jgi:hypothetical protein